MLHRDHRKELGYIKNKNWHQAAIPWGELDPLRFANQTGGHRQAVVALEEQWAPGSSAPGPPAQPCSLGWTSLHHLAALGKVPAAFSTAQ